MIGVLLFVIGAIMFIISSVFLSGCQPEPYDKYTYTILITSVFVMVIGISTMGYDTLILLGLL